MFPVLAIARSFEQQKQPAQAETYYLRARQLAEKYYGAANWNVVMIDSGLAALYSNQRQYDKAEPIYLRQLAMEESRVGKETSEIIPRLEHMGGFYFSAQQYNKAEPYYRRVLALKEKQFGTNSAELASTLTWLATIKRTMGAIKEAQQLDKRRDSLAKTAVAGNPK